MKNLVRSLFVLVAVMLLGITLMSCPTEKEEEKVIAKKYRGEYMPHPQLGGGLYSILLNENDFTITKNNGASSGIYAYTIGNDLYAKNYGGEGYIYGTFEDDNTLILVEYGTFIRVSD